MRPLQGEVLLQAWELGAGRGYLDRALTLLQLASPGMDSQQLLSLTIPQLNLELLRLRQISFGSTVEAFLSCPQCGTRLELSFPVESLVGRVERAALSDNVTWSDAAIQYSLRAVTTHDLLLASAQARGAHAREFLLDRCLSVSDGKGKSFDTQLQSLGSPLLEKFDELNAGAEILLQVTCPGCCASHSVDFDIARFLWAEVRHAATRLLRDVHELATAYGWTQDAILGMTSQRRNAYLEMVHA